LPSSKQANKTAVNKTAYCAIWPENVGGRAGNHIASGITAILGRIVSDHPRLKEIVLWSDSCVPQNKNSHMAMALILFLKAHPQITSLTQKFCEPGHSSIQEVDSLHSQIEKAMRTAEVFTPMGFVKLLLAVNRKKKFKVIQINKTKFKDFKTSSIAFSFEKIPFARVKMITYTSGTLDIKFKTAFRLLFQTVSVANTRSSRNERDILLALHDPAQIRSCPVLTKEKKADLLSMTKWMSTIDKAFYKVICAG
jgi:hypothetical protein